MAAGPQAEVPMTNPMRQAWEAYKASEEYKNSRYWAMRVAPFMQEKMPADEARDLECGMMPLDLRKQNVDGSMWAAFCAGWNAAMGGGK